MNKDVRFKNWQQPVIEDRKLHPKYYFLIHHKDKLKLGEKTDIGAFTYINAKHGVEIQKNVQIGSHCSLYSIVSRVRTTSAKQPEMKRSFQAGTLRG